MSTAPDPTLLPFRRERILTVGILALLSPIPLAFTPALPAAALLVYLAALGAMLFSVSRGRIPCLSNRALNVIGVLYLFLFVFVVRFGGRSLLKSALYLLLFTTVLKIASVRKERDLSTVLVLVGFLFVSTLANAFHVTILLFLVAYAFVAWPLLVRWSLFRDLASAPEEWERDRVARRLPGTRPTLLSVGALLVLAVPFFLALPRLRAPYMRGGFEVSRELSTGFTEQVDPDQYGLLKQSDKVFMRVTRDEPFREGGTNLRFRALTYANYEGRTWTTPKVRERETLGAAGATIPFIPFRQLDLGRREKMTVDLTRLESAFVPIPEGGVAIQFDEGPFRGRGLWGYRRDRLGNFVLSFVPDRTLRYDAYYGGAPMRDLREPAADDPSRRALGSRRIRSWVEERIAALSVENQPEMVAARLESELASRFRYSLEIAKAGPNPTEEFLFQRKAGTCEAFAGAMTLALREVGIPARFVTGFAGGEIGLFGRYVLVRGRDAHAWVEAWCGPERGWLSFDPTPPGGRPFLERVPWTRSFTQLKDGVEFFYDRFILGFGQGDQIELVRWMRESASVVSNTWKRTVEGTKRVFADVRSAGGMLVSLAVAAALGVALLLVMRRARRGGSTRGLGPAATSYRRLQRVLSKKGARITPASAPEETLVAAVSFGGSVETPSRQIVKAYVAESFGGIGADAKRLEELVKDVRAGLKAS